MAGALMEHDTDTTTAGTLGDLLDVVAEDDCRLGVGVIRLGHWSGHSAVAGGKVGGADESYLQARRALP